MASTCVITAEQAERAGTIEFLAAQLLQAADRVCQSGQLDRRLHRDLCFAADMLRITKPRGVAAQADPTEPTTGGA